MQSMGWLITPIAANLPLSKGYQKKSHIKPASSPCLQALTVHCSEPDDIQDETEGFLPFLLFPEILFHFFYELVCFIDEPVMVFTHPHFLLLMSACRSGG